jgi:hypothetical protein
MNDDDLSPLPPIQPGRYRHYKGGEYELMAVARHSETLEPMVVYRACYGAQGLWVRPAHMWAQSVTHDGQVQPRFAVCKPA